MTEHTDEPLAFSNDAYSIEDVSLAHVESGSKRVLRLLMIALLTLLLVVVIVYGLIPYVEMLNQPTAPPMPPAIQT